MMRNKLAKRIVSGLAAVAMTASNMLPLASFTAVAEETAALHDNAQSKIMPMEDDTSAAAKLKDNNAENRTLEYSDEDLAVTAEISDDAVISDGENEIHDAELKITANETENADGFDIDVSENERIRYYDIGFETDDGTAVSVDGVSARLDFNVETDGGGEISDIEVYSLDADDGAVLLTVIDEDSTDSFETVTVEDHKLGRYALKYTVDFHYNEYEYNICGGGSVLLSQIFSAFGIDEDVSGSTVQFTDDTLLQTEKVTSSENDERAADWRLISLAPFSTEEKLTVNLENGNVIEIGVTDDEVSNREIRVLDLNITEGAEYVNLFEKAAESYKNLDGSYTLPADFKYSLPTNPRTEWEIGLYPKAVSNEDGTFTVSAEDIPDLKAWVWTPDSSDEDHRIVYSLHLVTAGYNVINPGELEIRLPKSILPEGADSLELSLVTKEEFAERKATAKDSKNIRFVYEFDGDDIVFTNVKQIPSGFDGAVYISYHTTKKTYDYIDMSVSKDVKAFAAIYDLYNENTGLQDVFLYNSSGNRCSSETYVDSQGRTHRTYTAYDKDGNFTNVSPVNDMESTAAPVYINTGVEIKNVTKTLTQSNVYELWDSSWGEKPDGADSYIYFMWEIKSDIYTQPNNPTKITQKYDFSLRSDNISTTVKILSETGADDPDNGTKTVSAENIMYKMAGGSWTPWAGSTPESRTVHGLTEKNGTVHRDYVITRIPRNELKTEIDDNGKKIGTAFQIMNEATTAVSPKDNVDKDTEKSATEKYTYAPPVYAPPQAKFDTNKVGVFTANEKPVYNSNQVSSFELESLKNEETRSDIENLRYHVTVNSEGLAETFNGSYTGTDKDVSGYKKLPVEYKLTDNRLQLVNLETNTTTDLDEADYSMTAIDVSAEIKDCKYDGILRTFVSKPITDQEDAIVTLWLYESGSDAPVDVAEYNEVTDTWTVLEPDHVTKKTSSFRGFTKFIFSPSKDIVGYEMISSNPYYGTYYKAYPTVTLRSTDAVRAAVGNAEKIQINNYANLKVTGHDPETGSEIVSTSERMGKVFVAEAVRESFLTKKFISTDHNDIMNGEYLANWEIEFYETMQTGENEYLPVVQSGGYFYDLLPIMSTAKLDEIEVYPMYEGSSNYESAPLHEGGDYTVDYNYQTDKSGFKRVMLKVNISQPAIRYKLKIRTVHTHADILDYGRNIRNSVCYKTKNADIGGGRVNDGGTIHDGNVFVNMQNEIGDADKKKFMYSQATHYIPALISTVSEIQKTVSSETSPTASLSAIVTPNEEYEYHYRNMNTGSTYSTNLVIMDSIENYRTDEDGNKLNGSQAFNKMRDWYGTPLHFNFQLLDRKGVDYKIYVTEKEIDLDKYNTDGGGIAHNSTFVDGKLTSTFVNDVLANNDDWIQITQKADYINNKFTFKKVSDGSEYDLSEIKGFMIDFGNQVFMPNESVLFGLTMRAPASVSDDIDGDGELKTYNNVYRYHDTGKDKDFKDPLYVEHTFTHQDKTDVIFRNSGDVKLRKVDASDNSKVIHKAVFVLEGTSVYGTSIRRKMSTDANGNIIFRDIEQGEYTLRETDATENYQIAEPRTVKVNEYGIASISGADELYAFDITIRKKRNKSDDALPEPGAQYILTKGKTAGTVSATAPVTVTDAAGIQDGESVAVWTNSAGVAEITNVPAGEYILTHGTDSYSIKVKDEGTDKNVVVGIGDTEGSYSYCNDETSSAEILLVRKEYGIEDEPRYHADLYFKKVIVDPADNSETVLSGAEFTLTTIGNGSSDHKDKNQYDETVNMKVVSSDIGLTFENLGIGKYILYESKTPDGAVPDDTIYYVWVQGDKNTTPSAKIYTGANYSDPNHEDYNSELKMVDHTYVIKNTKTSDATLYKRDNVNLTETLAGAQFDLYPYGITEDGNTVTEKTEEELKKIVCDDGLNSEVWRKTADWSMGTHVTTDLKVQYRISDSDGMINLYELQPGVAYWLVETKAPKNHKTVDLNNNPPTWDVRVTKQGEVKVFQNNTEISEKLGDSYVITNQRTYDKDFTVVKTWVGGAPVDGSGDPTTFPAIKMSTQETEEVIKVATLNKTLFKQKFPQSATSFTRLDISTNRGDPIYTSVEEAWGAIVSKETSMAGKTFEQAVSDGIFTRVDANAKSTPTDEWYKTGHTYPLPDGGTATVDFASEEGVVYMACINNHTYFWSDAKKIHLWKYCNGTYGFQNYENLTGTLDFTYFNADRVENMNCMFLNCSNVNKIILPNISNSSNSSSMQQMFNNCGSATQIILPVDWNCKNNTSFKSAFENCKKVSQADINLSGIITSEKLTTLYHMFYNYGNDNGGVLQTIEFGDEFDTSRVINTSDFRLVANAPNVTHITFEKKSTFESVTDFSHMFSNDTNLISIDGLQYFNTQNARTFQQTFDSCRSLVSLDLSSFTTGQGVNSLTIRNMFDNCHSLKTIYANPYEWPNNEFNSAGAFSNCNSLLLRINAAGTNNKYKSATKYAVVNGSPYIEGKGKSGETYAIDPDNNYIGYFTDWSQSPNYSYVYNKYREAHPELGLAALTGSSAAAKDRGRSSADIVSLSAIPAFRALRAVGDGAEDVSPFTAPEVVYLTGKTALSEEAARSILMGLGLGSTYDPTAYYVAETVTVNDAPVENLVAKWTINSDEQWECTMMVYDPDAECYVWEDTVPNGYTPDHSSASKLFVEKNTGYAEITNSKPDAPVPVYGSLALSKLVYLDDKIIPDDMRADDEFTFTVTLTPDKGTVPNKARYGGIEFERNAAGTALVGTVVIPKTVQDTDKEGTEYGIVLSRIPVDWTYSISEDTTANISDGRVFSADYSDGGFITTGEVATGTDDSSGTIAAEDTKRVTWRNNIKKSELVLMKSLERKEDDGSGAPTDKELTDSDESIEYAFTVVLTGLYPNDGYSYVTDTGTTGFIADENGSKTLTVKLKHDGSVTFRDLPVGTVYTVSENLPTESNVTYETRWNKYEGDDPYHYAAASAADASAVGTSMTDRLDRYEWVRFDNTKITKKTIDVNVEKFWFADWYGETGYESSAETALVTLQRNDGMHTVTPDDGTRTLDSSNGWKDTFADLPVKVDGNDVSYTLGEITVGGYKPGIISSEVGELTYGTVNTLNDPANQELAYFAYKIGYTFKIDGTTYADKAVELCKTDDGTVYMFYDGDLHTVSDDGSGNNIAEKYTGNNKRTEGTQNRFMKKTDPKNAAVFPEVYETYVNYDSTKVYFKNETDADALPLGRVIAKKGGGYSDILYILHSDGIFYKAEKNGEHLKLGRPVFRWNTSDDVISDPEGNIKYIVTNVKEKTYSVAISKKVEGNLGNKDRRFGFDVIAGSLNGKFPVTRTYEDTTTMEEIEFSAGVGSVEISHGETVVISNLPEGMNLLIREREYKEYDVRSKNATGSIEGDPNKGGEITLVMDSNQSVTFTNTLVGTIPTGIELNIATVIVLGLLTAGLLILMKEKQGSDPDSSEQ